MILILKINMDILFVTIYLTMDYKYQKTGKMINISIHNKMKMVIQKL